MAATEWSFSMTPTLQSGALLSARPILSSWSTADLKAPALFILICIAMLFDQLADTPPVVSATLSIVGLM